MKINPNRKPKGDVSKGKPKHYPDMPLTCLLKELENQNNHIASFSRKLKIYPVILSMYLTSVEKTRNEN